MFAHALATMMAAVADASGRNDTPSDVVTVAATMGIAAMLVINMIKESLPESGAREHRESSP
jgi:hypothetical protein